MAQALWAELDQYFSDNLIPTDTTLESTLKVMHQTGLPSIQVTPLQGRLLAILAQSIQARSILEIGTLGGYSTICLARTLPAGGRLISLEYNPKHAEVARTNIANAGLSDKVDVRIGLAQESLAQLAVEKPHAFDFVFIDADKPNIKAYFEWTLKLTHPGSLIFVDNIVLNGEVGNPRSSDSGAQGVRNFMPVLASEPTVTATAIQTVSGKGYDGFAIALVAANGTS